MNMRSWAISLGIFLSTIAGVANAYELDTHGAITYETNKRSVLNDQSLIKNLGIDLQTKPDEPFGTIYYDVFGTRVEQRESCTFENTIIQRQGAQPLALPGWLVRGAIREDDLGFLFGFRFGPDPHDDPYGPFWRVMHHFFDPLNNRPLTLSAVARAAFSRATGDETDFRAAPDWALGVVIDNTRTPA